MKFLSACVSEALRLYPPAPIIGRDATRDVDVGGLIIRKYTLCFFFLSTF
jgi:cytochrome P450